LAEEQHPVALITGGSRGIGAATALALASRGHDIAITYRNKAARAQEIAAGATALGVRALASACDITKPDDVAAVTQQLREWAGRLDILVLNASGGLERDLLALDPDYPMHINRDAQVHMLESALPLMPLGSSVVFVTSHWAHLYGRVQQLPAYETIGESKYAGEQALRARQESLAVSGIRLLVVTGDLIEGTITPKLLERAAPGLTRRRRDSIGDLPTAQEMGEAIAVAATDASLPSGHTVVIGESLDSMLGM
jgi:NAD(P)-dependent dehydrogenase (short-subunit alcohol dehydrogenase family)